MSQVSNDRRDFLRKLTQAAATGVVGVLAATQAQAAAKKPARKIPQISKGKQ